MHLATLFGIPIRLHWSFLALMAGIAVWVGPSGILPAMVLAVGLFGSVLLHELGHALAARRYGIQTAHITLYPFGGIAAILQLPRNPLQEFVIAVAGPAVNGALFVLFGALWLGFGGQLLGWLALINIGMGLFNLIPAFPMDGGRVLRALLATQIGWVRASDLAIKIGSGFAWVFVGLGLLSGSFNLVLIGGFLLIALAAERRRLAAMVWERAGRGWTNWAEPVDGGASAR